MAELELCRCGREPIINIDMSRGPGMLCHVACDCGLKSGDCWDVRLPLADIVAGWRAVASYGRHDHLAHALAHALNMSGAR